MFVNIMCNMQSCDNIFSESIPNEWRKLSQDVLINYMLHILHKLPCDKRRKAYRLSQMIKRSFQQTAFLLLPVNSPSSKDVHRSTLYRNLNLQFHPTTSLFPKVLRSPMVAHSPLFEFKTPHILKFSWSGVKHYPICCKLISWSQS